MFIITFKSRCSGSLLFRCGGWCLDSMIADLLLAFLYPKRFYGIIFEGFFEPKFSQRWFCHSEIKLLSYGDCSLFLA